MSYLSLEQVLLLHYVVVDAHFSDLKDGSEDSRGVQDPAMLLSALHAPQHTYDGQELVEDVLDKAAVLMRSLIKNHPFHNGNKRTAVIATIVFLENNGFTLVVPDKKLIKLASAIASRESVPEGRIRRWLAKYAKRTYEKRSLGNSVGTWGPVLELVKRFPKALGFFVDRDTGG